MRNIVNNQQPIKILAMIWDKTTQTFLFPFSL